MCISWPDLVIMDTINQVLCSHSLVVLWNGDRASDSKRLLNERRRNGDYPLNRNLAALACIVQFSVASCRRKICIKVGVTKAPTRCQVEPGICRWERDVMARSIIRLIKQVRICDVSGR